MQLTVVVVCIYFVQYICISHLYLAPVNTGRMYLYGVNIYLTRLVLVLMHHHGPLHSVIVLRIRQIKTRKDDLVHFLSKICLPLLGPH